MNLSQFNRILAQTLLLPVLALAFVSSILVWQVRSAQRTVTTIQVSDQGIAAATRAEKLIVDEESGLRGYQLTGDRQFLQPYHDAAAPLAETLTLLRRTLIAQNESPRRVDAITEAEKSWRISFAEPMIAGIPSGWDTRNVPLNLAGKRQMDELRQRVADVLDRESDMRGREIVNWRKQVDHTIVVLVFLVLAVGVFISVFTVSRLRRVSEAYQGTLDGLRRHAQATFESEERLRTTLTSIGDAVIVCDVEGRVEMLNTVAQELTGWKQAEAFRKPLEEVFHIVNESTRDRVENPVAKVRRLKGVVGLANHTVLIRRDGSEININDSGAPIRDRTSALSGVVLVFRDITQERQAQNALLASEKLAVAGRLAATIAHEIHNPLDSVANLLYLLKEETDPVTSDHFLHLAQQELDRIGQVSRAMLGLYREAKSPVEVNVREMIDSVLVLFDRQFKDAEIKVKCSVVENLEVRGFPAELRQVLTNLIANATDAATPGGTVAIEARRATPADAGPSGPRTGIVIQVSDNGGGIEPLALERIFEPFFTTKGEGGTGLGLWVSRGIIEKHGGTITITSNVGRDDHGTSVTIFLPVTGPPPAQA